MENNLPELQVQSSIVKIERSLIEEGSVHFGYILKTLEKEELSEIQKQELANLALQKVQRMIELGNLRGLEHADELLNFLGIENLQFSDEFIKNVNVLFNDSRLDNSFLISLSPFLYDNKLPDGRVYDKKEYTKEKLKKAGFPDESITDEFVNEIWKNRELLILLHNRYKEKAGNLISLKNILELNP